MSADAEFKQFIDRILRCREAEDAAKADTKAVYADLKALGYDKTAAGALVSELRKREKNPDQFAERETVLDLYRNAYQRASGMKRAIAHTHENSNSSGLETPPPETTDESPALSGFDAPGSPSPSAMSARTKADVMRLLRPHCQHPDDTEKCGGQGTKHCQACIKAAAESEVA